MAPLRTKLNHTLHKINDKFKRQHGRSIHPPEHDAAQAKQPRTLPAGGPLLPSGQGSAPPQDIGLSSLAGEHVSQLPRSSGSGSATSVGQSSASGSGASSPGSSMSIEFLDQRHVAMQAAAPPAGTLTNPIGRFVGPRRSKTNPSGREDLTGNSNPSPDSSLGDLPNIIDLTSTSSPASPHGQKRYWAEPSLPDSVDVDYSLGQKSKMYRSSSKHHTNVAKPGCYGGSTTYPAPTDFERPNFDEDLEIVSARRSDLTPESHVRSTRYRSEDDLAVFGEKMLAATCQRCSVSLFATVEGVITRTRDVLNGEGVLHPLISCAKCKTVGCVACGRTAQSGNDLSYKRTGPSVNLAWCCNEGRLFLIWSLCCGTEFKKLGSPSSSATLGRLLKGKLKGSKPDSASFGKTKEPPPRALSKGTGYGGDGEPIPNGTAGARWDTRLLQSGENALSPEERLLAPYFAALRILISSFAFEDSQLLGSVDKGPPTMVKFMLRRSPLLPTATELLRNDSMEAMSVRKELYEPLLGLIRTMGRQASISGVVYEDNIIYPREEQLIHFSSSTSGTNVVSASGSRSNQRGKGKQLEQGSSIARVVQNLARQCRHLNHVASGHIEELKAGESSNMLALSRVICELAAEQEAFQGRAAGYINSTISGPSVPGQVAWNVLTRSKEAEKAREDLRDLHRDSSVLDLPEEELCLNFRFKREALEMNTAMAAKGRMKKLVAQIANLRTSLPEGIWVRHGSSRLDVMKVLMVGPQGTPYEHGLFEFDMFCPAEFPNTPPSMFFRTTGGGHVRFNPNLYEDGKVCLSILGTWSGETWNAAYSTLLQVLVSIHGMILVDQPWYNEPGRERMPDKAASRNYNTQIQQHTIQHAMIDWLNQRLAPDKSARSGTADGAVAVSTSRALPTGVSGTPSTYSAASVPGPVKDDPIWGDIIRKHFAANGKAIMETVKKWKQPIHAKDMISTLQEALTRHGFL